jgi:hypothetical protein
MYVDSSVMKSVPQQICVKKEPPFFSYRPGHFMGADADLVTSLPVPYTALYWLVETKILKFLRYFRLRPNVNKASIRSAHVVGHCNLHTSAHLSAPLPSAATRANSQRLANCSAWSWLKTRIFTQRYPATRNRFDSHMLSRGYGSGTPLNTSHNRQTDNKCANICNSNENGVAFVIDVQHPHLVPLVQGLGYALDDRGWGVWFPVEVRTYSPVYSVQTGCGIQPASHAMDTGVLHPRRRRISTWRWPLTSV